MQSGENHSKVFIAFLRVSKHPSFTEFQNLCRGRSANPIFTMIRLQPPKFSCCLRVYFSAWAGDSGKISHSPASKERETHPLQFLPVALSRGSRHHLRLPPTIPFHYWSPSRSGNLSFPFVADFSKDSVSFYSIFCKTSQRPIKLAHAWKHTC